MICPNCQTTNRDSAQFCRRCGQFFGADCPNCGHQLPETPVFCDNCGCQVSPLPAAGPGWLHGSTSRQILSGENFSAAPQRFETQQARPVSQSPIPDSDIPPGTSESSLLQKYLPGEMMKKLEAARASGSMAGERRVVTMLFCDVKGSTAAAEQLDPEEWTEIINGAFEHMIKPVYKFEGTVARLMGDAILAFFGAPIAHEDDPQRAVLAGLEIVRTISPYREAVRRRYNLDFNVRVGINTGQVVVGAVGSDLRMEYTAMGDAINLAARMEQTAEPGTVQVAHDTYKLVAPLFDFEPLGGIEIKGKAEPIQAYRALGSKAQEGRLRGIAGLEVPLVGRGHEMSALIRAYDRLSRGVGGIISLIAEAGYGKSRRIRELQAYQKDSSEVSWYQTASQSYETAQPYNLFRRLILGVMDATAGDPPEVLREKIRINFAASENGQGAQVQRVYESLFGLSSAEGDPPLEGETFKQLFIATTRGQWMKRAEQQPVVLIFDDLQWADAASVELISNLFVLTEGSPLLLICSLRPERNSQGWNLKQKADTEYNHRYTELMLKPLLESESLELLSRLASGAEIPAQLLRRILEKAAGIPYYLEEVVRGLMESRALVRENGAFHWAAANAVTDVDLPDSLQSLLVARIDRLEEDARRTLQLASVVGPTFYFRVLERVGDPSRALEDQLDQLVRVNMVREAAREPELEYTFSNVLTQEAAYQTILLRHRRQFHRQVGEALETLYPDRREELAPVLAVHFQEANESARSLEYLTLAGDTAFRMYALDEAVSHYENAIKVIERDPGLEIPVDQVIHLYTRLGRAYEHQYNFDRVREVYEALDDLAEARSDPAFKLAYLTAMGTVTVTFTPLNDPDKGEALAEEALVLARKTGDRRAETKAHWNLLLLYRFFKIDLERAKKHGETAMAIARDLNWEKQLAYILNDIGVVYCSLTELEKGVQMLEESRDVWRKTGNLPMLADNLNVSAMVYNFLGQYQKSFDYLYEGIEVVKSINNLWNEAPLRANLSDSLLELGKIGEAVEQSMLSLQVSRNLANTGGNYLTLTKLAHQYNELGMVEEGLEVCRELTENEIPGFLNMTKNFLGVIKARFHLLQNDPGPAIALFEKIEPNEKMVTVFPFADHYVCLVFCELMLAIENYDRALSLSDRFIRYYEDVGIRFSLENFYYYRGLAHRALGRLDAAQTAFERAMEITANTGARRMVWKILFAQSELAYADGDSEKGDSLREQAREALQYIVDRVGGEPYRGHFLARRDVQAVLEGTALGSA